MSKILEMQSVAASEGASDAEKRRALRFVVHLLEDLHQPLHVGDRGDRGGNDLQVRFFEHGTNLHRLWDEGLIERHATDEAVWLRELEEMATGEQSRGWCKGPIEDYATESLQAARDAYLVAGSASFIQSGEPLDGAYFDRELPVVRRRLAQAGVRLACLLNTLFPS